MRLNTIAKLTFSACVLLLPCTLAAQTYKCKDANGKITYSGKICSDLGLKDAGEVKDTIQTVPAYRPPAPKGEPTRTPAAPSPAPAAQAPAPDPASDQASDGPSRRCFTVKTAKGNATRCNDAPPDADAPPDKP